VTVLATTLATAALAGCDSVYYSTMKRFGMEKRGILANAGAS
jgi:hypothetical protein